MRPIKFRAWNVETKEMLPVSDLSFWVDKDGKDGLDVGIRDDENVDPLYGDPNTETIPMQFTGLLDKNDREIYEGDILLIPDEEQEHILDDGSGPIEPFNHLSPVVFLNGGFGIDITDKGDILDDKYWSFDLLAFALGKDWQKEVEVVGNIYESKELLGET